MKAFVTLLVAVALFGLTSQAQVYSPTTGIVLNPGETFRYDFEALPLAGHHDGEPWTMVQWSYDRASLNPGDSAYWGLWIGGSAAAVWESTPSLTEAPPDWSPGVGQPVAVTEKAGSIVITFSPESSGILRVPGIEISLDVQSASGGYDTFAAFIVPEPTTLTLLGLGSLALVMVRRRWA